MCPNGVEFKTLGEVCIVKTAPMKLDKKEYQEQGLYPIVDQGQKFIVGYTDNAEALVPADDYIIFGDHTREIKYVDFTFAQGADGVKILKTKNEILPRFLYHVLKNTQIPSRGYNRHWTIAKDIEIPLPPIEIQKKIVECLDKFSALAAELQAELQLRRKQYEYYRTQLLTPHSDCNSADNTDDAQWEWKTLGEVCKNCDYMRKPITATHRIKGEYPYYGASGIVDYVEDYIFDGEYLLISEDGANLLARSTPIAFSIEGKNWVNNHAHVLKFSHRCTQKIVEYYINSINIEQYVSGGAQPKLNQANLNKIPIPLPSLAEQERIVSILDKFEALTTSLSDGIPAEQAAQQKRYEYYRDLLLTFDRKAE